MCTITGGSFLSGGGNMDEEESTLIWNVDEVDHFANQPEFQFTSGPILPAPIQPWFESLINTEMPYLHIWMLSLPKTLADKVLAVPPKKGKGGHDVWKDLWWYFSGGGIKSWSTKVNILAKKVLAVPPCWQGRSRCQEFLHLWWYFWRGGVKN